MDAVAELVDAAAREAIQVHWGGGTPTFLPPEDVARLMASVRRRFRLSAGCEIGVEVDPRRLTTGHLDALAEAGVNRLSMGVQDVDPTVQRAVNRIQPVEETWGVLEGARKRGMTSVNLDLIYGLPHQTPASFAATVDEVIRMSPDRIALFNFAYLPELFAHQRAIDREALPDPEAKLSILEDSIARLTGAGYVFIGMDHFARPEDPLAKALADRTLTRNFQGYSTCGATDLVAFGVSSISHVAGGFAQNVKEIPAYERALDEGRLPVYRGLVSSPEDRLRRDVILRIMGHFHLDKDEIEAAHGIEFDRHFAAELAALEPLAADGLLEIGERELDLTPLGRLLVRNVAMVFDEYLAKRSEVRYSRTV
jgi:oxygen-independent coproporphyrinogen-3 oxidase